MERSRDRRQDGESRVPQFPHAVSCVLFEERLLTTLAPFTRGFTDALILSDIEDEVQVEVVLPGLAGSGSGSGKEDSLMCAAVKGAKESSAIESMSKIDETSNSWSSIEGMCSAELKVAALVQVERREEDWLRYMSRSSVCELLRVFISLDYQRCREVVDGRLELFKWWIRSG